jgi:hypothetical protein
MMKVKAALWACRGRTPRRMHIFIPFKIFFIPFKTFFTYPLNPYFIHDSG